jgi:hypothetical protein
VNLIAKTRPACNLSICFACEGCTAVHSGNDFASPAVFGVSVRSTAILGTSPVTIPRISNPRCELFICKVVTCEVVTCKVVTCKVVACKISCGWITYIVHLEVCSVSLFLSISLHTREAVRCTGGAYGACMYMCSRYNQVHNLVHVFGSLLSRYFSSFASAKSAAKDSTPRSATSSS